MFKTTPNRIRKISAKFTIALLWSTVLFSGSTQSQGSLISLDSLLQNAYIQSKEGLSLKNLPTKINDGDLYDQAYAVAQEQSTTSTMDAVIHATYSMNHLVFGETNQAGNCNLQSSDTIAILYQVPWVAQELRQIVGQSSRTNNPNFYEDFWNACNKLYACYNDEKVTDSRQTQFCKDIAVDAYNMGKIHSDIQNSLMNSNYGSNIYIDNDSTNGSFDLLVDIERIGDVLFEGNKEPAEILFFKLPTVGTTQGGNSAGPLVPGTSNLGFGESSLIDGAGNSNSPISTPSDGTADGGGTGSSLITAPQNSEVASINDFINNNSDDTPLAFNNNGSFITNQVCLVPSVDEIAPDEFSLTETQIDEILTTIFNKQTNLLTDPLNPSPISALFPSNGGPGLSNSIDTQRAIDDAQRKLSCSNECAASVNTGTAQWEQEASLSLCETNCCIDACSGLAPADQFLCTTDCLCGEYASPNNIFRIKYCKIPVKAVSPLPRNVMSVEEIIDELDKLIKKLKEQGMPVKLAKPEEFMDSTNENLKFANLFTFDVFVKFKPMFDTIPRHEEEQKKEKQLASNHTDILGFGDLTSPYERNKYVMIDDAGSREGSQAIKGELSDLRNNVADAQEKQDIYLTEQAYVLAQRMAQLEQQANGEANAVIGDELDLFIRQNKKFWQEVVSTLDSIGLSSKRLMEKVINEEE